MRRTVLVTILLATLLALVGIAADTASADSASISRDARGPQPSGSSGPLGGPPTPRIYGLGQDLLFVAGIVLLVAAALLGAYTLRKARPHDRH